MKICLIANDHVSQFPTVSYGGIEICVESLAWGLHQAGEDFFVITPKGTKVEAYPFKIIETEELPSSISNKPSEKFAWSCRKIIQREKPDVIWSQSNWSADVLADLGIPIICTFHDSCEKKFGWIKKHPNVKYRFLSNFSYNNWVTEEWEKEKSFVCYSGVSQKDYRLSDKECRKDYILWVAGLKWGLYAKGLDTCMFLASELPEQEFRVYGAGNQELEEKCRQFSKTHPNFNYLGELKRGQDHDKAFSEAKCFLMPTRIPDTFPRTVLEAMTKGTPVIGSPVGAIPEMVGLDRGGLIMPQNIGKNHFNKMLQNLPTNRETYHWSLQFHIDVEINTLKCTSITIV